MNIDEIRKQIDKLDDALLGTINKRAELAQKIGKIKAGNGKIAYVPHREKKILSRLLTGNKGPLPSLSVETIFREVLNACRSLEEKLKIAYFGPEATFTHQAALKNFGSAVDYIPVKSISDVFAEVDKKRADYGVVPIENSTDGMITHTLDMFMGSELVICSEISLPIEHCLLSKAGDKTKIKKLYSFYQPLLQCRNWLESNMPNIRIVEVSSTAEAAKLASKDIASAAIASRAAAELYKLNILVAGIQDSEENFTRFLVIGKTPSERSGADKTSIMLSIKDKVGALHDMLMCFKKEKISLTKIESRPTKKKAWEYMFFIDFEGHSADQKVKKALTELQKSCVFMKVLGSYPKAD